MTVCEVAQFLTISERTAWTLVKEGKLPAVRFGRIARVDRLDVEAFIDRAKGGVR